MTAVCGNECIGKVAKRKGEKLNEAEWIAEPTTFAKIQLLSLCRLLLVSSRDHAPQSCISALDYQRTELRHGQQHHDIGRGRMLRRANNKN